MSNISYCNEQGFANISNGKVEKLNRLIENCCSKLDFDDSDVKWFIADIILKDCEKDVVYFYRGNLKSKEILIPEKYILYSDLEKYIPDSVLEDITKNLKPVFENLNSILNPKINTYSSITTNKNQSISTIEELIINAITRLQTKEEKDSETFIDKFESNKNKYISQK